MSGATNLPPLYAFTSCTVTTISLPLPLRNEDIAKRTLVMRWAEHTERVRNTGNAEPQSKNLKGRLVVGERITLG